ncbi:MAG TPA: surface-adhesin E family protein [Longimicrobium sp.]|nr:surface-adhesin E family protein [Longimicrobium sp.]
MKHLRTLLIAATLLACAPADAADGAQEITFQKIPWNASPDVVRGRLEAQGYTYGGVWQGGRAFLRPDSTYVVVVLRGGEHPVAFFMGDQRRGARAEARFRALADSLQARLGQPVDRRPESVRWEAGLTSVAVRLRASGDGKPEVQAVWLGPGWLDEMAGQGDGPAVAPLPAGYIAVSQDLDRRVAVDTSSISQLAGGALRARYRVDYPAARSDDGEPYDAVVYGMDFDCARGHIRMFSRTTLLAGRRQDTSSARGLPWRAAAGGSEEARVLDGVCRARGRRTTISAPPERVRTFGPVPAGWVVVDENEEMRWVMDSASVSAKGEGVYFVNIRHEWGYEERSQDTVGDALLIRSELDCGARRYRVLGYTLQLRGRDVRPLTVPAAQAVWNSAADKPGLAAACRIAGVPWT